MVKSDDYRTVSWRNWPKIRDAVGAICRFRGERPTPNAIILTTSERTMASPPMKSNGLLLQSNAARTAPAYMTVKDADASIS